MAFFFTRRNEEFINELPKEIADEIINDVNRLENEKNIRECDISLERLADYIALEYFPEHFALEKCLKEFTAKVYAASFNEIMVLCEFIVSREKLFDGYGYTKFLMMTAVTQRADKNKILKSLKENGHTEMLLMQKFMEDLQKHFVIYLRIQGGENYQHF